MSALQTMIQIKERKEMEDQFKKAQKPWAKHLAKVEKCKADYHAACKTERSAANQERNASSDSSLSNDQVRFRLLEVDVFEEINHKLHPPSSSRRCRTERCVPRTR